MTPDEYFHTIAEPTVAEFLAEPTSVRRALLACMACYHVIDALAVQRAMKPEQIYPEMVAQQPSLLVIKAVALLAKHVQPTQSGFDETRFNHLNPDLGAAFSDGAYFDDGSTWADMPEVVVLESPNFSKTDLTHALQEVMAFWKKMTAEA